MTKLALYSFAGVLVGMAAVWWIQPENAAATAFLMTLCVAFANAVGLLVQRIRKPSSSPDEEENG